ncbi:hypothetical protein ABW19_dt0207385 [Dactylella cylindrospora]|nr:hypothetical protein ABW19_dt0207385 [Dactylella cylindrospora]
MFIFNTGSTAAPPLYQLCRVFVFSALLVFIFVQPLLALPASVAPSPTQIESSPFRSSTERADIALKAVTPTCDPSSTHCQIGVDPVLTFPTDRIDSLYIITVTVTVGEATTADHSWTASQTDYISLDVITATLPDGTVNTTTSTAYVAVATTTSVVNGAVTIEGNVVIAPAIVPILAVVRQKAQEAAERAAALSVEDIVGEIGAAGIAIPARPIYLTGLSIYVIAILIKEGVDLDINNHIDQDNWKKVQETLDDLDKSPEEGPDLTTTTDDYTPVFSVVWDPVPTQQDVLEWWAQEFMWQYNQPQPSATVQCQTDEKKPRIEVPKPLITYDVEGFCRAWDGYQMRGGRNKTFKYYPRSTVQISLNLGWSEGCSPWDNPERIDQYRCERLIYDMLDQCIHQNDFSRGGYVQQGCTVYGVDTYSLEEVTCAEGIQPGRSQASTDNVNEAINEYCDAGFDLSTEQPGKDSREFFQNSDGIGWGSYEKLVGENQETLIRIKTDWVPHESKREFEQEFRDCKQNRNVTYQGEDCKRKLRDIVTDCDSDSPSLEWGGFLVEKGTNGCIHWIVDIISTV